MNASPVSVADALLLDPELHRDERGWFARVFDVDWLAGRGLATEYPQHAMSFNERMGTLRGLHYQVEPHAETKIVRCTAGAIWDVIVDLRPESPTYKAHYGVELSAANHRSLYIPAGMAHGFVTLAPATEVMYLLSARYAPQAARGVRWNDPAFGIEWPVEPRVISERDAHYPDFG